ncbi:taurine catabolism dioxygenase [Nitzschia inconspicua]|uniref:Taurine catabolism dioxygenase n=1 Tax=Nitzschia inconspicua TaxID=303405 RepID=A0A9K3Q9V2_9STRA|nr:taurine catabolism dioxygenase [Nitzschia inconspicua]
MHSNPITSLATFVFTALAIRSGAAVARESTPVLAEQIIPPAADRFEMFTISGEDLRSMSDERIDELKTVLVPKHGVILLKNQTNLSKDDIVRITERFGKPVSLPDSLRFNNTYEGYPALARVSNVLPNGTILKEHKAAEYWHSDGDFWGPRRNYIFNFLYAEIVPPVGGATGLVDLRRAYHRLDDATKEEIKDLEVVVKCKDIPDFKGAPDEYLQPDAYHKIRHEHIVTGTVGLYVGTVQAKIHNIPSEESDRIMKKLVDAITDPSDQLVHQWEAGDMLIWDNTSTMHRSMGGYLDHPRVLYRTQAFMDAAACATESCSA